MNQFKISHNTKNYPFSKSTFNLFFQNIRSLLGKFELICDFLTSCDFQIAVFNETWLSKEYEAFYNFPEYSTFHSTRCKPGGGVSISVKNSFSTCTLTESFEKNHANFLVIKVDCINCHIISAYRPPDSNYNDFLLNLDQLLNKYDEAIFVGDTNFDLFSSSKPTVDYTHFLNVNGFKLINSLSRTHYTRKGTSQNTCLDHAAIKTSKFDSIIMNLADREEIPSDHRSFTLSFRLFQPLMSSYNKTITVSKIDHANIKTEKIFLNSTASSFPDIVFDLERVFSEHTTTLSFKQKFRKQFMNSEINRLIKARNNYRKLLKKFPDNAEIELTYIALRNKVTNKIRQAKVNYAKKNLDHNRTNPSATWRILNNILRNTNSEPRSEIDCLKVDNHLTYSRNRIAEELNLAFIHCTKHLSMSNLIDSSTFSPENLSIQTRLDDSLFNVDEARYAISTLSNSKSKDIFGLSNKILKFHSNELIVNLTAAINLVVTEGKFPDILKKSLVIPIFKGGDKSLANNYRPISIVSPFSKVIEKMILVRLTDYLEKNKILSEKQFGFLKKSNTEIAVVHLFHNICSNLEKKLLTAVLFIDLSKAFDCIDFSILERKIKDLQLPKNYESLICSFFVNRSHAVSLGEIKSNFLLTISGVPQGSILGPTLFLLYIDSISKLELNGKIQMYADDVAIVYGEKSSLELKHAIEHDLLEIQSWLYRHRMAMNTNKTNYILFNGKKTLENFTQFSLNINIEGKQIERVSSAKYLGLIIDEQLNFIDHINFIKKKIIPISYAIKRARKVISKSTAEQLYFAYVHSHLLYLNVVWGSANQISIQSLFTAQKKAIKAINNLHWSTPSSTLFSERILPLPFLIKYSSAVLSFNLKYNLVKCLVPLTLVENLNQRSLRRKDLYYVKPMFSRNGQKDFFFQGLITYNNLPEVIRKFYSIKIIKNRLKEHYFELYLSSLE